MKNQKLQISIDSESVSIYREMDGILHIVCWHQDEWKEDPETVVPAIIMAVHLFYTDQVRLLTDLGFSNLILK
jgi:hypothetical protein